MAENRRVFQELQTRGFGARCLFQIQGKLAYFCFLMLVWFPSVGGATMEKYPLAPPNTDSPRTTFKSFIDSMNKAYTLASSGKRYSKEIRYHGMRAIRCLDLSQVALSVAEDVGVESALLLKEVLDRVSLPPFEQIPDRAMMKQKRFQKWVLPHTEITVALVEEGPRKGEYLFTAETVNKLKNFYERSVHLPYKPGSSVRIYGEYTLGAGWMIPGHFIQSLPKFFKAKFLDQAVWQWLSMLLVTALGIGIVMVVFRWTRRTVSQKADERISRSFFRKMLFPLCLAAITALLEYFLDEQINITGTLLIIIVYVGEIVFLLAMVWVVNIVGNAITEYFIAKPSVHSGSIDANMLRIISRIVTIAVVFVLLLKVSSDLGVSLTPIFASAGIVGLALALAARETVANFFGGLNILLDRPFRVGNIIILDSGERGEVIDVGLRSTRIITRDDVQISVPNSKITDSKVINESVPMDRFRVRIGVGVAYGSDIDQVEELLLQTAKSNSLITVYPEPRVRFRKFGDSALEFELLCWAYKPDVKGKVKHELHRDIYKSFNASGISIPFPQRGVHLIKEDDGTTATDEGLK